MKTIIKNRIDELTQQVGPQLQSLIEERLQAILKVSREPCTNRPGWYEALAYEMDNFKALCADSHYPPGACLELKTLLTLLPVDGASVLQFGKNCIRIDRVTNFEVDVAGYVSAIPALKDLNFKIEEGEARIRSVELIEIIAAQFEPRPID